MALLKRGSAPSSKVGQTVINAEGTFSAAYTYAYANIAHSMSIGTTSLANFPASLSANGYPAGTLSSAIGHNDLNFVSGYYGHYKAWWTGTAAGLSIQGPAVIVYNGGTAVNGLGTNSGTLVFNYQLGAGSGAGQQPTQAAPVEFVFGALLTAVSDGASCSGGTAGLVCLTANNASSFNGGPSTGAAVQINNVTNLAPGPWIVTKLDNQHIQLQGSTFSGSMAVVGGSPGTASEVVLSNGGTTWSWVASGLSYTISNMVICRSQNTPVDDCTTTINGQYVNPDYVTVFKQLNPRFVRFMDFTSTGNNRSTNFTYRPVIANLSWQTARSNLVSAYYGGAIANGGSDNFTVANPSASPASGAYGDGEIVIGQIGATATNVGFAPTLQISGRAGAVAAPVYNNLASLLSFALSGTGPTSGTTTLVFTGGGLASSHNVTYSPVAGDATLSTYLAHLRTAIDGDATLNTAGIKTINSEITSSISFTLGFNPNINSSGVAALGNGMTLTASDTGGAGTVYSIGTVAPGYLPNSNYMSFTWSALLQGWITRVYGSQQSGLDGGPPLEFLEEFCNRANVGMWYNVPALYSASSITSLVTNIANSGVKELTLEVSNETWNFAASEADLFQNLGMALGLKFPGNASLNGFYGLRVAQTAALARSAWVAAGRSPSQLFISDAYMFVSLDQTNRLNGGNLNPGSNVTLAAYGGYGATSVATNYSAFPNRPVDNSDFVSPAPYFVGAQLNIGANSNQQLVTGVPLTSYNCLLVASYNYVNGNSTDQQNSLNFLYTGTLTGTGDAYNGTLNGSTNNNYNISTWAHGSGNSAADYFGITTIVASYDTQRAGGSLNPLGVVAYEGDWQVQANNASDATAIQGNLTTLGDSSGYTSSLGASCGLTPVSASASTVAGDAANIVALHVAFKNDTRFRDLYLRYFNDFNTAVLSQGNRISLPATYGFIGTSPTANADQWSKYPNSIYTTPYQSWNAIQSINN